MCVLEQFKDVGTVLLCQLAFDAKVPSWSLTMQNYSIYLHVLQAANNRSTFSDYYGGTFSDDGALCGRTLA